MRIQGLRVDRNEVRQACYGMRSHSRRGVFGEHEELRDHDVEGTSTVDFDIEFSRIVLACLFKHVKSCL
jgi:hypothetical protein